MKSKITEVEHAEKYVSGGLDIMQLWCINLQGGVIFFFSYGIQQSGSSRSVMEAII